MRDFKVSFKFLVIFIIILLLSGYVIISSQDTKNISIDRIEKNSQSPFLKENDFEVIPSVALDNNSKNDVDDIIRKSKIKLLSDRKEDAFGQKDICSYGCESSKYKQPSNPIQNERKKSLWNEISNDQDDQSFEFSIKKNF
jgi:hypothetical protein